MEMSGNRIAIVTGANRGLGLETCRQLAGLGFRVVLAARRQEAAEQLGVDHVQLDVLVNNAGFLTNDLNENIAETTVRVNLFGTMSVTDTFRPILSGQASVVMVSSGMGELACLSPARRRQFADPELSRERLVQLMQAFIRGVKEGTHAAEGWPDSAYRVSKVGLNAFTRILAREFEGTGIRVNTVCPGWVWTDMGGAHVTRSVEEGARSIVWAATSVDDGPSGGFFRDGERLSW